VTNRSIWRLTVTLVICAACAYFFVPLSKVRLGLDLKGGVHFELEVQSNEALEADLRDTRDRLQDQLQGNSIHNAILKIDRSALTTYGIKPDQWSTIKNILKNNIFTNYNVNFEQDSVTLTQKPSYQQALKNDANKRALQIIENRINQFGVAEPEITATGNEGNRIVVELPGVGDSERERIKNLLTTPGRLEQRLVSKYNPTVGGFTSKDMALRFFNGQLPNGIEVLQQPVIRHADKNNDNHALIHETERVGQDENWVVVEEKVYVDGADIIKADPTSDQLTGNYQVSYILNKKGSENFAALSDIAANEQRLIAIVLDNKVVSVLTCKEKIVGGSVCITGRFTKEDAEDFALKLKSGAMRASMKFLEERAMGPSLGMDSIKSGITAAFIGFFTIVCFMVCYYKWSGVNAIIALIVNLIVMLGLMGSFRAVITLPGIAGFALTMGMAVDANILIFERIREELARGVSIQNAIDTGFSKVFWTIVDSHITQLFAAILLFIFGTGPVKGFAVTLTVGVCASLFTSIYISRFIYDWILESHPNIKTLSI
jgi:preprotein translocase subunit SecD